MKFSKFLLLVSLVICACTAVSTIHIQAQSQTPATPPHLDDFFSKPKYGSLTVSPSGKLIAFIDFRQSNQSVIIVDLQTKSEVNRIEIQHSTLDFVKWATEERILVGITYYRPGYIKGQGKQRDENGKLSIMQRVDMHRVQAMDVDGSNRIMLFQKANKKIKRNVDLSNVQNILINEPDYILMPAFEKGYDLWKVNIRTGNLNKIEKGSAKTYDWKTNKDGKAVVRYDYSKSRKSITIRLRDKNSDKWTPVTTLRREDLNLFNPIGPTHDPRVFYISARPNGYDKVGIFKYNLQDRQITEKISNHDTVDLYTALIDDAGDYLGSVFFEDRYTYQFVDKTLNSHMRALHTFFGNERNILIKDVSVSGETWILYVNGPRDPGSYYTYNRNTKRAEFLLAENYSLDEQNLSKVEVVKYTARDGMNMRGYLTKPVNQRSTPAPLLIMPHGGPQARDYYTYDKFAQYMASLGYQVFQPNFRGSRGFGKKFEEAGYKEWGGKMQDDVTDAVTHLSKTGQIDPQKMCIIGLSYGGFSALSAAVKTPDLFKCAISINGVSDLEAIVKYDLQKFKDNKETTAFVRKAIGDIKIDADMLKSRSPIAEVGKINIPILLIHGNQDDVVPVSQSQTFYKLLLSAKKNVSYIELENVDHNLKNVQISNPQNEEYFEAYKKTLLAVEGFLAQHLAP